MTKVWLSSPHMGGNEKKFIDEAFQYNWIAPLGPNVDEFEEQIKSYVGIKSVTALSSGTAALHLGLILANVQPGDEVICQSFTFSASANPIVYQGATPIFIDSESNTWNIDPVLLEKAILDRISLGKKPKIIIPVHLYGMPSDMEAICAISEKYDIPILEDAAEALGSSIGNKMAGSFGLMSILSFNGNKIITTSGGGALISNNSELIQKAKHLATQARDAAPHYQHSQIGYNYRMSNICAGIGRGQMEVLDLRVKQRRFNHDFYKSELGHLRGITFQNEPDSRYFSNRWLTCIVVDPNLANGVTRESIRIAMDKENIESRPLWKPMHLQPVFAEAPFYGNGISERLFINGLCLPSGSNMSINDLQRISNIIKNLILKA